MTKTSPRAGIDLLKQSGIGLDDLAEHGTHGPVADASGHERGDCKRGYHPQKPSTGRRLIKRLCEHHIGTAPSGLATSAHSRGRLGRQRRHREVSLLNPPPCAAAYESETDFIVIHESSRSRSSWLWKATSDLARSWYTRDGDGEPPGSTSGGKRPGGGGGGGLGLQARSGEAASEVGMGEWGTGHAGAGA
ncbi:hypothetical protein GUJ93_ZPchr0006g42553 [Zizania palustris]|uniref:Uncharacterized protein n=1 Tax=Zizania palustris TaxID=103762 RepID=A0A8J5W4M1_ZIZPA|nr:hypothetical protein GUJ93_ZPchr0006g42553 [Zizania palustris]